MAQWSWTYLLVPYTGFLAAYMNPGLRSFSSSDIPHKVTSEDDPVLNNSYLHRCTPDGCIWPDPPRQLRLVLASRCKGV